MMMEQIKCQESQSQIKLNIQVSEDFQKRMYKYSKNLMTIHALLSTFGAISYSILVILATNDWQFGITPQWNIYTSRESFASIILTNSLAVVVNINLCFAALLVLGFYKEHGGLVRLWCVGQFLVHVVVTVILFLSSVVYNCNLAVTLSCPLFLYYALALSFARQIIATISMQKSQKQNYSFDK